MSAPSLFKWRHFLPGVILLNVRWYCRYALSYRDLEEIMAERGVYPTFRRYKGRNSVFLKNDKFRTSSRP